MSVSKDVIKQCLISKQREVDEAVIVNRPVDFEENGNYVIVGVRHAAYQLGRHKEKDWLGYRITPLKMLNPNRSLERLFS